MKKHQQILQQPTVLAGISTADKKCLNILAEIDSTHTQISVEMKMELNLTWQVPIFHQSEIGEVPNIADLSVQYGD